MRRKPAQANEPSPSTPGSKLRARIFLVGLGLLVVAYAAALVVRP